MQKPIAIELKSFAEKIAERYSRTDREGNSNKESFAVESVIPTSDNTAVINFRKSTVR